MKKISLQNFLIIFFTSLTVVVGGLIVAFIIQVGNANKAIEFKNEFRNAHYYWTEAQSSQHDFLIKYKDDLVFYQTEQNKFIKRSQIYITNTKSKMDSLIDVSYKLEYDLSDDLQQLSNELTKIEDVFEEISHLLFLRGARKTGIIGNCFTLYDLSLNSVTDKQLKDLLVKSHVAFLEYLNNPNFSHYEDFLNIFTMMNSYIRQNKVVRDTGLIDTTQFIPINPSYSTEFIGYVNEYKQSFSKLVSIDRKLFLNDQANLMNQWTTLYNNFGEVFSVSLKEVNSRTADDVGNVQSTIIISVLIMLILFASIIFIIPRVVSRRVKEIQEYIEPLKSGVFPDVELEPTAFSEVIEISDSLSKIIKSLKDASAFATEIGNGNFSFEYTPVSEQDELGNALILLRDSLSVAQKDEVTRRKEDRVREWTNTGIAKFSDILRQAAKDITELSTSIIKELVNYLNSNQGGVFVLNDDNKDNVLLELAASYAYSKERKKKKSFLLGEGLVGTCAVEKATIYMTEIPEDYISITSGLGGANPRSLLIAPLKHEENILGVLEIASFNEFEKYQIEFVEKIAESIASTLSITKINERTAKLLQTAKLEAEQRSLKEEELRQNLEELQATQERAAYRESELNNLINLVNKVSYIIELDVDGNVVTVPDSISEKFGIENNEIAGHHFSEFDFSDDSVLKKDLFWQKLLKGEEQQYQRKFKTGQNEVVWFNDYIVPFIDATGQVLKFICVSFDISQRVKENEKLQVITKELQTKENEILQKVKDVEKARQNAEQEKMEALAIAKKLEASEDVLKKALDKNKTQLEKIEIAVKNSEIQSERFKMLFEKSNDAIQLLSDNKFIDCNPASLRLFKYNTKGDFINTHPSEVSPENQPDGSNSMELANSMMIKSIEEGSAVFNWTHKKSDGTNFPAEVTLVSFKVDNEQFIYALVKDLSYEEEHRENLEKVIASEKEAKNKYEKRSRDFREKLEKYDIELEKKEAEIFNLKKLIEDIQKKK
ncbi:MAG: GAF domain-containing protein [Bacteroidales bacterium]|nr:GAF domain-containing protein [Bacteroidales bacterium]